MITLKQSRRWWIERDLKWIIENASFAYTKNYKPWRIYIVTKEKIDGSSDCFGIDNDNCGIVINSHGEYKPFFDEIEESCTDNVTEFIIKFFKKEAREYINPPKFITYISNLFRKQKDKIISIETKP